MWGFAHLGVMRALEEAGIEVDVVGGTSIGAIMGAFFAAELNDGARVRAATRAMVDRGSVVGYTLPLVSVSSARKVSRLLRAEPAFAPGIEDLWRPFFCVSASLNAVREVVHERGPVWRAIRSSISLPGVYPPVHRRGDLLVDGGVLNNLPVDVMATRVSAGPIIAVDLQPAAQGAPPEPFDVSISGWKVLASRLNPFTRSIQMPGLADVVLRSLLLASTKGPARAAGPAAGGAVPAATVGCGEPARLRVRAGADRAGLPAHPRSAAEHPIPSTAVSRPQADLRGGDLVVAFVLEPCVYQRPSSPLFKVGVFADDARQGTFRSATQLTLQVLNDFGRRDPAKHRTCRSDGASSAQGRDHRVAPPLLPR